MGNDNTARQEPIRRTGNIVGTKTGSTIKGVERMMDIFLGGCPKETTCDDIKSYCNAERMNIKKVVALETKSEWHQTFKLSVVASERDGLLDVA